MSSKTPPRRWIRECPARWNPDKARIIAGADEGTFDPTLTRHEEGELVAGDWFRVEESGRTVGYGLLDATWGDAEVLLAVAPEARGRGVGTYILEHLTDEAIARGLNYLYNEVQPKHPEFSEVTDWLKRRAFTRSEDGRLTRYVCRAQQSA